MKGIGLSESAVLVSLHITQMPLVVKDKHVTEFANTKYKRDPNQTEPLSKANNKGYFRKKALQHELINNISTTANRMRTYHREVTSPWDAKWRLVAAPLLLKYLHEIQQGETEFFGHVDKLIMEWDHVLMANKTILGDMFRYEDYPKVAEDVRKYYSWKIDQSPVPESGHLLLKIEDKALGKLKSRLEEKNNERMERILLDLFYKIYEPISDLSDRLTTGSKKVTPQLLKKLSEVSKILPLMNVGGDQKVSELSSQVHNKLCGFTSKQIRDDKYLKTQLAKDANEITERIESLVGGANAFEMLKAPV